MVKDIEQIINDLGYIMIESYLSKKGSIRKVVIQDKIGYKYDVQLPNLQSPRGISFVHKGNPYSLENISLWLCLKRNDFTLGENRVYLCATKKLNFYHSVCREYFQMSWNSMSRGVGCPVCSGRQIFKYNSLAYKFPQIAREWHPTKNGELTADKVAYGSHKKVWWICPNGHEYLSSIGNRTNIDSGCKQCADEKKESKLALELKQWAKSNFKNVKIEYTVFRNPLTKHYLPYDIYIPLYDESDLQGLYIEIHGIQHYKFIPYWHKTEKEFEDSKYRDKLKKDFAKKYGQYIEIDLRKIKNVEDAIKHVLSKINP